MTYGVRTEGTRKVIHMEMTFGEYIRERRKGDCHDDYMSLRMLAAKCGLSPVHLSNIENDRRPAPAKEHLERIADALRLDKMEQETFYELAAKSKDSVAEDLPDYIKANNVVRAALRTAKDVDATDEEWQEFIEKLRRRNLDREGKKDE